jgi:hypothetical protein
VQAGAFYDRVGEPVPFYPEWTQEFEVLPDDAPDLAERRGRWLLARDSYGFGPTKLVVAPPADLAAVSEEEGELSPVNEAVALTKDRLRAAVPELWRQLGAVELVVAEVAEAFDGEDPALPDVRELLDRARGQLNDVRLEVERYVGQLELEEPDEALVEKVRVLAATRPS